MTESEYQSLIHFLTRKFDGVEVRLTRVEVSLEEHRHDFRALVERVQSNTSRIERIEEWRDA
ncbi:MAG: hypothetical protein RQ745_10995 [Longimicrobiales bacterium]|nr:hypothetical protein [Longimicrobiales bacterium]